MPLLRCNRVIDVGSMKRKGVRSKLSFDLLESASRESAHDSGQDRISEQRPA